MNIEALNAERLGFLLNIPKEAALAKIYKALGDHPENHCRKPKEPEIIYKQRLREACKQQAASIAKLSKSEGIDFEVLIADIQKNFCTTRSCVDYVLTYIDKKLKPKKNTQAYPATVNLPVEVRPFVTHEQRDVLRGMVLHQFGNIIDEHEINILF